MSAGRQPASKTVVLTAPQGWGKTRQAAQLQARYGCGSVVDDWDPSQRIKPGALHLTNAAPYELTWIRRARVVTCGWEGAAS